MSIRRDIGNLLAMTGAVVAGAIPDSTFQDVLWSLAIGYIFVDMFLRARDGYLLRRPHWTRQSWRHYLIACTVPAGALVIVCGSFSRIATMV